MGVVPEGCLKQVRDFKEFMMNVMQEPMELVDYILIISLINLSISGPWLLVQFHK
jgi:hypothetical protein